MSTPSAGFALATGDQKLADEIFARQRSRTSDDVPEGDRVGANPTMFLFHIMMSWNEVQKGNAAAALEHALITLQCGIAERSRAWLGSLCAVAAASCALGDTARTEEYLARQALGARHPAATGAEVAKYEQTVAQLYQGPFLDGLADGGWAAAARADLAARVGRFYRGADQYWRRQGASEKFAECARLAERADAAA